jgi:hypothetical protein
MLGLMLGVGQITEPQATLKAPLHLACIPLGFNAPLLCPRTINKLIISKLYLELGGACQVAPLMRVTALVDFG